MSAETSPQTALEPALAVPPRARVDLFLISVLLLFLELACIRWFPAHVLFLTFFTNTVLLACFLGMSLGCLAVNHKRNYLAWTPYVLGLSVALGLSVEVLRGGLEQYAGAVPEWLGKIILENPVLRHGLERNIDVGNQASPQLVFFGTEYGVGDPTRIAIPVEVFGGVFFLMIALAMVGPGQELGRALTRIPNRVQAYTLNILGSIVGIVLFAACSYYKLQPLWWFLPVIVGIAYFLYRNPDIGRTKAVTGSLTMVIILLLVSVTSIPTRVGNTTTTHFWSPYYRIDYAVTEDPKAPEFPWRFIQVNLIGHQAMIACNDPFKPGFGYALPHMLNRDCRQVLGQEPKPFEDVLIIGAGSGNDVSRALQWGAKHVDAVEIDPVIQSLGAKDHPNQPYEDPRVSVHLGDGRNFLRSGEGQYDLIVYALVDSLVLHSGYSNIRLESFLFTDQAFKDVRKHLKPGGIFVMYNYFRQGWVVSRLRQGLDKVFGAGNPVVFTMPHMETIEPEKSVFNNFTVFIAGDTERFQKAFSPEQKREYWLPGDHALGPDTKNGFELRPENPDAAGWERFGPARVLDPAAPLLTASDDWPFLYLRRPMIPDLSIRGAALMGGLALLLLFFFLPRKSEKEGEGARWSFDGRMFFLGAGFMLIETKAVVHMALLFGSTWMVNSVVFFAVLVMILAANLYVLKVRPQQLWPYYAGLAIALALNVFLSLDSFLGMNQVAQVVGSCLLVFAPILFAGVIFAVSFSRTSEPDRAFGANIAGAMAGGLAEYSSMLLGFQFLVLVALAFYALSAVFRSKASTPALVPAEQVAQPV